MQFSPQSRPGRDEIAGAGAAPAAEAGWLFLL